MEGEKKEIKEKQKTRKTRDEETEIVREQEEGRKERERINIFHPEAIKCGLVLGVYIVTQGLCTKTQGPANLFGLSPLRMLTYLTFLQCDIEISKKSCSESVSYFALQGPFDTFINIQRRKETRGLGIPWQSRWPCVPVPAGHWGLSNVWHCCHGVCAALSIFWPSSLVVWNTSYGVGFPTVGFWL